jgi:hypothetical protein
VKSIKLSECTKEGQIFLYDRETVGLQYILRMIFRGNKLPKIHLCENDKNFDDAISNSLSQMYNDVINGIDKEEYELNNINTIPVVVDISKKDIRQVDEEGYKFKIVKSC